MTITWAKRDASRGSIIGNGTYAYGGTVTRIEISRSIGSTNYGHSADAEISCYKFSAHCPLV